MSVISLCEAREQKQPHATGDARCISCKHEWVAVAPHGTEWLECPACSLIKGAFLGPFMAAEGEQVFECNCGSRMFYITARDGVVCHGCGHTATGWF